MLIASIEEAFDLGALGIIGGIGGIYICFYVIAMGIAVTLFVFWLISIIDISQRKNEDFPNATDNSKTTWLILLLVTLIMPVAAGIAGIVYYANVVKKAPRSNTEKPVLPPDEPQTPQS